MKEDNKTQISLRMSQDEKEAIQEYADASGMTFTSFMICKAISPPSYIDNAYLREFTASRLRTERDIFELEEKCKMHFADEHFDEIMNAINQLKEEVTNDYDQEDEMFHRILKNEQNDSDLYGFIKDKDKEDENAQKNDDELFDPFYDVDL